MLKSSEVMKENSQVDGMLDHSKWVKCQYMINDEYSNTLGIPVGV
jgi:hypothetical protein